MNPNPLSIRSRAIVPVGIPEALRMGPALMSWEAGASLGTFPSRSQETAGLFSEPLAAANLPRFRVLAVFLLVVVFAVLVFVVFVEVIVGFVVAVLHQPARRFVDVTASRMRRRHVVGSTAG